jgi:hypothetical protein
MPRGEKSPWGGNEFLWPTTNPAKRTKSPAPNQRGFFIFITLRQLNQSDEWQKLRIFIIVIVIVSETLTQASLYSERNAHASFAL